ASRNSRLMLEEIGRRLGVEMPFVLYLTPTEVTSALREGSLEAVNLDEGVLRARFKHGVVLFERGRITFFSGASALELSKLILEHQTLADKEDFKKIRGMPASPGKARGTVKIIAIAEDMRKMREGDVLVSPATNPNLVSAMKKASAIVTNEGGVTCHAAIVSRELGIPCVTGTRVATRVLKDGDEVEVDATRGIVTLIKRA
ncbi:MAG: PEP-utilizing enzyme, partial [Candidatus Norongarragalinales archaeon]